MKKALKSNAFSTFFRKSMENPMLFHRFFEKAWSWEKSLKNQWVFNGFSKRGVNEKSIEKTNEFQRFSNDSPPTHPTHPPVVLAGILENHKKQWFPFIHCISIFEN